MEYNQVNEFKSFSKTLFAPDSPDQLFKLCGLSFQIECGDAGARAAPFTRAFQA
jgi:hypothetical protein